MSRTRPGSARPERRGTRHGQTVWLNPEEERLLDRLETKLRQGHLDFETCQRIETAIDVIFGVIPETTVDLDVDDEGDFAFAEVDFGEDGPRQEDLAADDDGFDKYESAATVDREREETEALLTSWRAELKCSHCDEPAGSQGLRGGLCAADYMYRRRTGELPDETVLQKRKWSKQWPVIT